MSIVDFPECFMIYKWYNVFEEYTIKTKFYRLKQEILEYINSSEFIYPSDYFAGMDSIETFKTIISKALKSLGGSAYIKLLWSSPKDSGWLCLNGRPIVDSFEDLCLVMANSDNLINDFKMISEGRIQHPNLALREPCEIDESLEFRCFIKDRQFVGCCQRNVDLFHQFLHDQKSDILKHIGDFIANRFLPKWKNEPSLILDVFLSSHFAVKILDIGPFNNDLVDPILFEWSDFDEVKEEIPIYRVLPSMDNFCINVRKHNGIPVEFIDNPGFNLSTLDEHIKKQVDEVD